MLVAPGKMGDYLNWLKNDYRPALETAVVRRFQVSQPIFGAAAGEVVTMRMLKNLAEIDGGAVLSRALTDDQARAVAAKSVTGRSYTELPVGVVKAASVNAPKAAVKTE